MYIKLRSTLSSVSLNAVMNPLGSDENAVLYVTAKNVVISVLQPCIHFVMVRPFIAVFDSGQPSITSISDSITDVFNCFGYIQASYRFAVIEGHPINAYVACS